ncbi:MAG: molybdopterin-containing oxidoreductase family protein [Acetobacteraceae bacterium]
MSQATIYEAPRPAPRDPGETVVTSTCGHNCGGRCVVNAHVQGGRIVHISTDARRWNPEHPPLPACARGVGQQERMAHPDRLLRPLRRTGPRGSGRFAPIPWDEALDEVAHQLRLVRDTYGPAAILDASRTGSLSVLHGRTAAQRFLYMLGGCTVLWSSMSAEAEIFAIRTTFGPRTAHKAAGREPSDYPNSQLILMWGWSPGDGTFGTGTLAWLREAKRRGSRIVCVDPRLTETSRQLADEHVFIRPGTDTAALLAMAQVIVSEGLHDQGFCDRFVLGFDEAGLPPGAAPGASWRSYLTGTADGVAKTPEWAAPLTGVPAATLRRLARDFATARPAAFQAGYAPGRTARGEQFHRAAAALAAITGNIGIPGGNSSTSNGATGASGIARLPTGENPAGARVASPLLADLLARGRAGGYPADIRLIYAAGGNLFNQAPNAARIAGALGGVEFIVAQDHFLTPTARCADIVLPATTFWERNDVHTPWAGAGHYAIYMRKALEPAGECRNDIDIFAALAERLGIAGYSDRDEDAWLRHLTARAVDDFDAFAAAGVARFPAPADAVAYAREIREGAAYPFSTPSGKIEVYCPALAADPNPCGLGPIAPVPAWVAPLDPRAEPSAAFPLRLCSPKSRARTHSIHGNQPGLARIDPDTVWLHPDDAAPRGIADGARVRVFNAQGQAAMRAEVTRRIAPGVVAIKEGAWFAPDSTGLDQGGAANALTADYAARCGATTYNANAVEVARLPD